VSDQPAIEALDREAVVLKWSDLGIDLYGNGIVFSDETLRSDPEQVKKFNSAMQKGFLWACEHPEEAALDFQNEVSGFETGTVTLAIDEQCALNWGAGDSADEYGVMSEAGVQKMIDVAAEFLGLDPASNLTTGDVYSNAYMEPLRRNETIQAPRASDGESQ
jgi:NitT/TauT family transport system substrate-binding protein